MSHKVLLQMLLTAKQQALSCVAELCDYARQSCKCATLQCYEAEVRKQT